MKKLLLLNPPGEGLYLRDSYCSKLSKSGYLYHPVDLMLQWGQHVKMGWHVELLDCIAQKMGIEEIMARVKEIAPTRIIGLAASVSLIEDVGFYRKLRQITEAEVWLSGDLFPEGGKEHFSDFPNATGFLLDYSSPELANYDPTKGEYPTLLTRDNVTVTHGVYAGGCRSFGIPEWEKIDSSAYLYPFALSRPPATVLTSFGCPHHCDFCVSGHYPLSHRPVNEVLAELSLLQSLGYREVYFADQTFNFKKSRMVELLQGICKEKLRHNWSAFVRLSEMDEELTKLAARAGCHTMIFGIENGNEALRIKYGKKITNGQVREKIQLLQRNNIRTVGTFILGLPGETPETIKESIDFAIKSNLDFASFNVAVSRPGTTLLESTEYKSVQHDQSYGSLTVKGIDPRLTGHKIHKFINLANRRFYFRPTYLLKRLISLRSIEQLRIELAQAFSLFN